MADRQGHIVAAMAAHGERIALCDADGHMDYAQLARRVAAAAGALLHAGFAPGDRIALLGAPSAQAVIAHYACIHAGMVACPLNTRLPAAALARQLDALRCAGRLAEPALLPRVPRGLRTLSLDALESRSLRPVPGVDTIDARADILFTSGTSGSPKPAAHSLGNHWFSAAVSNRNIPLEPGDRWLLSLPLYHVSGLGVLFRCLLSGAAVAVPAPGQPLDEALAALRPTHVSLVSAQLDRLLHSESSIRSLQSLKAVLTGGGPIPERLIRRAHRLGIRLHTTYGLTETSSQICTTAPGASLDALLTAGAPLEPGTVQVAADGEILVRGPALFEGYLDGDRLRRPATADGWFPTGDLGRFDDGGRLLVLGRKDNLFITGGENVQPEEIEAALTGIEGVAQCIVAPRPDPAFGERPVAFVRTDDGDPPDADALRGALAPILPGYKIPVAFLPWPADLDATAKPDRSRFALLARESARE